MEEVEIPAMITQPLVENAIEHGVRPLGERGKIEITYELKEGYLWFTLTDNGKGFPEESTQGKKAGHISRATQIIEERLSLFGQQAGSLLLENIFNGNQVTGAKVILKMPYQD